MGTPDAPFGGSEGRSGIVSPFCMVYELLPTLELLSGELSEKVWGYDLESDRP